MKSMKYYFYKACKWAGLAEKPRDKDLIRLFFRGLGAPEHGYQNCHEWFRAAQQGDNVKIKALIEAGGNNSQNSKTDALFVAAQHGHTETVRMLLDTGAKPGANGTELRLATERGHVETAKVLKEWIDLEKQENSISAPGLKR